MQREWGEGRAYRRMADEKKAILLRIPPDLARELHLWARDELRSVNAQIEFILRTAINRRRGEKKPPASDEPLDEPNVADRS